MSKNVIFYFDRLGFVGHFKPMRITRIPSQIEEMFCRLNTPITLLSVRSQYFLYCWQCESQHPPLIPSSLTNPPPPPNKPPPPPPTPPPPTTPPPPKKNPRALQLFKVEKNAIFSVLDSVFRSNCWWLISN